MLREITAFAPASVSNVASGFDIMGFALDGLGDRVTVRSTGQPGVRIGKITGTHVPLPMEVDRNTAGPPVLAVLARYVASGGGNTSQRGPGAGSAGAGIKQVGVGKGLGPAGARGEVAEKGHSGTGEPQGKGELEGARSEHSGMAHAAAGRPQEMSGPAVPYRAGGPGEGEAAFDPLKQGLEIDIHKGLPIGSGIGSSATSAVAAAFAANVLLDAGLSLEEILECSVEGEKIASGAVHVDNLAPSLYGGFILVRGYNPVDVIRIKPPESLWCTIIYPHIEIKTIEARRILPKSVPLSDVITQTGNAAGLVAGLITSDLGLISRSLKDVIAEPARAHLIPCFREMKAAAIAAGALGCSISGAGPSLFALSGSKERAKAVAEAMSAVLQGIGLKHSLMVSGICQAGTRIITGGKNSEPEKLVEGSALVPFMA